MNHCFNILAKPIGPICNLGCKYCFYLEKEQLYRHTRNWIMEEPVLETFIKKYIDNTEESVVSFVWQGGEPTLLGVDYFRHIVELQKRYAKEKSIHNSIQTNGILLNHEWADFLKDNNFLVGISLDGPQEIHDYYRRGKGGESSFADVMNGVRILQDYGVEFNTLTTVHHGNEQYPLEVYRFLKRIGSKVIQFIPIVERQALNDKRDALSLVSQNFAGKAQVSDWSVNPQAYGNFLCTIFDEWVRSDVGEVFIQLFDVTLEMWAGLSSSLCVFQKQCGNALAMEHNGDLYSCDHYVYPKNFLGNITDCSLADAASSLEQLDFGKQKADLPRYCQQCDVRFACNGECPKHRFMNTSNGEKGLNYLCAAYRKYFHHVSPYMQFMLMELAQNRAPANVMNWLREK